MTIKIDIKVLSAIESGHNVELSAIIEDRLVRVNASIHDRLRLSVNHDNNLSEFIPDIEKSKQLELTILQDLQADLFEQNPNYIPDYIPDSVQLYVSEIKNWIPESENKLQNIITSSKIHQAFDYKFLDEEVIKKAVSEAKEKNSSYINENILILKKDDGDLFDVRHGIVAYFDGADGTITCSESEIYEAIKKLTMKHLRRAIRMSPADVFYLTPELHIFQSKKPCIKTDRKIISGFSDDSLSVGILDPLFIDENFFKFDVSDEYILQLMGFKK